MVRTDFESVSLVIFDKQGTKNLYRCGQIRTTKNSYPVFSYINELMNRYRVILTDENEIMHYNLRYLIYNHHINIKKLRYKSYKFRLQIPVVLFF